jgi:spore coat polysaccharide biosynthesis protein SpsF (cytidylyltransferase family)
MRKKTMAIVQARMGSTRFPGKVLAEICGMPMIEVLLRRARRTEGLDDIVVATTTSAADDGLAERLRSMDYRVWRGSEQDVLDRYWRCATEVGADIVVRLTADDPLKDPAVIAMAIDEYRRAGNVDYVSNTIEPTFPEGLDVEVVGYNALCRANSEAVRFSDREHVTPYIWRNAGRFAVRSFSMSPDLSHWRWTVDHPADLEFVRQVLGSLGGDIHASYLDIIDTVRRNPRLMEINSGKRRGEGYLASLEKERESDHE